MTDIRHEQMRIGGEKVDTEARLEVRYPYTDEVIGTVPMGTAEHARRAFEIAANRSSPATSAARSCNAPGN
jgi:acyl-CoA reductase-like NAD-dependent aldehyde dehydrogenase